MDYQSSTGRNQRPKGFKAKQVLQSALLLSVCVWLVYQFKHSYFKGKEHSGIIQSKLIEEHGVIILGRKGNAGWSSDQDFSESEDVNLVVEDKRKEDGGGGDDELDGNAAEEFFHKENEYVHANLGTHDEEKEIEKEPELQYMVSLNNMRNNSDNAVGEKDKALGLHNDSRGSASDHDEQNDGKGLEIHGDEKDPKTEVNSNDKISDEDSERQVEEPQIIGAITDDTIKQDQDEAVSLHSEEEGTDITESKQEIAIQSSDQMENNATVLGRGEMLDGVHGFPDENGVPRDLVESTLIESRDDHQANILHNETTSNSSDQSRFSRSTKTEEVAFHEHMDASDLETKNKSSLEDSKTHSNR